MNFRFEPYCENCEFVEPVAIRNSHISLDTGERIGDKVRIVCNRAHICKRLYQHIKAVERAERVQNCSDEGV